MKNEVKSILAFALVLAFAASISAQQLKKSTSRYLIDFSKPAVYIKFVKPMKIKVDDQTDDENNLFFKITNNSRSNILFEMSGVSKKEYGDASFYYAIQNVETEYTELGSTTCHLCSINPIKTGQSMTFSIFRREAKRNLRMRIAYSFDWEYESQNNGESKSSHYVDYYFENLPESIKLENN